MKAHNSLRSKGHSLLANNSLSLSLQLAGNYESLVAGLSEEALVDFTGGVPEILGDLQGSYSTEEERNDLFRFLEREYDNQSLICASIQVRHPAATAIEVGSLSFLLSRDMELDN